MKRISMIVVLLALIASAQQAEAVIDFALATDVGTFTSSNPAKLTVGHDAVNEVMTTAIMFDQPQTAVYGGTAQDIVEYDVVLSSTIQSGMGGLLRWNATDNGLGWFMKTYDSDSPWCGFMPGMQQSGWGEFGGMGSQTWPRAVGMGSALHFKLWAVDDDDFTVEVSDATGLLWTDTYNDALGTYAAANGQVSGPSVCAWNSPRETPTTDLTIDNYVGTALTVPDPDVPGDTNLDGYVDLSDLSTLASNWNTMTGMVWADGDFNADGAVDLSDLSSLAANWGTVPATGAVPEPATMSLLAIGGLALIRRKK